MERPTARPCLAVRSSPNDVQRPRIVVRARAVRTGAAKARVVVSPRTSVASPTTTVVRVPVERSPREFFAARTCMVARPPGWRARNPPNAVTPRRCATPMLAARWPRSVDSVGGRARWPRIVARVSVCPASRANWPAANPAPPWARHALALRTVARETAVAFRRAACQPSRPLARSILRSFEVSGAQRLRLSRHERM